jgi:hypothetical protein
MGNIRKSFNDMFYELWLKFVGDANHPAASGATEAKQDDGITALGSILNKMPTANDAAVTKRAPHIERSGFIAIGGESQLFSGENLTRNGFYVQNTSDLPITISWFDDATSTSLRILPNGLYECPPHAVPPSAIYIFGTVTGQTFYAGEF